MQKVIIAGLFFFGLAFALQLPHEFQGVAQHFGYINVNQTANANMFYWMFESQGNPSTDPLVLWMTGGPGCSSELALFFENGPFWVDANGNLHNNPYSWNTHANLLYVDQPIGTGFSYADSDYVDNEAGVDQDMWILLTKFLALYPQYAKLDFYIIGESYGGHYVPSVAAYIVQQNQISTNPFINLKGIGVGNGWVNPKIQYGAYGSFAYSVGLINSDTYAQMNQTYAQCVQDLNTQDWNDASNDCGSLLETVLQSAGNINVYNYKLPCNPPPLCYDFSNITNYLNTQSVQQSLGVNNIQWQTCSDTVNELFGIDREESFAFDVPLLLNAGMRVLIYSGKLDLICNYYGLEWVEEIQWNGKTPFNHLPMQNWILNGKNVAQFKSLQNLTKMQINDAGHMVPFDRPSVALQMLDLFLNDQPF